jgi:putative ABC transport system permease protein
VTGMLAHWLPALRMARRDMRRHPLRTTLIALMVTIPVLVATFGAQLFSATSGGGEQLAHRLMGGADALVKVTRFPEVHVTYEADGQYLSVRPARFTPDTNGHRRPARRPRSAVSLQSLLPAGSRVTPWPTDGRTELASGGNAGVLYLDVADAMAEGIAWVDQGRAPAAPDEVALPRAMADELGLLDASGSLRPDATLRLADGQALSVVGLGFATEWGSGNAAARLIAPPDSLLRHPAPHRFLVDLPGPATPALVQQLAAHGVAMEPRDVVFHARAWHAIPVMGPPVDPRQVAVAMMLFFLGLAEVVLLVGSAFAVGSRRQVRDLGLLASSGGAPSDVRRVVLAQGVLLGIGATAVGLAAGVALFLLAGDALWYQLVREPIWAHAIAWRWLVGIGVLGSVTGLAAALLPAWSVGRLTPVTALSGRFPIRPGESRAGAPAGVPAGRLRGGGADVDRVLDRRRVRAASRARLPPAVVVPGAARLPRPADAARRRGVVRAVRRTPPRRGRPPPAALRPVRVPGRGAAPIPHRVRRGLADRDRGRRAVRRLRAPVGGDERGGEDEDPAADRQRLSPG